jgi:hypothetical protein
MNATLFRDLLMNMLLGLVGTCILLLIAVSVVKKATTTEDQITPPGNVTVIATWKEGPIDVDLWTKGPTDEHGVGYTGKNGNLFDLLRDDLGNDADGTPLNFETAFSRGLPDGEYIVNVHCFTCDGQFPIVVNVKVQVAGPNGMVTVFNGDVTMFEIKQELTVVRFTVVNGKVDPASVNNFFISLRKASGK